MTSTATPPKPRARPTRPPVPPVGKEVPDDAELRAALAMAGETPATLTPEDEPGGDDGDDEAEIPSPRGFSAADVEAEAVEAAAKLAATPPTGAPKAPVAGLISRAVPTPAPSTRLDGVTSEYRNGPAAGWPGKLGPTEVAVIRDGMVHVFTYSNAASARSIFNAIRTKRMDPKGSIDMSLGNGAVISFPAEGSTVAGYSSR